MSVQSVTTSPATAIDPGIGLQTILVDTTSGTWTASGILQLPEAPQAKARYRIKDSGGQADTKSIVVDGNGQNIDGQATRTIQNPFETLLIAYTGTQWVVI